MKKQQVFYIHGGSAFSRYENFLNHLETCSIRSPYGVRSEFWSSRLREDLGESCEVFTPSMPNSNNSKYEEWKIWFERHFEFLHEDVILVGWSQGAMFLLRYLTENKTPFTIKTLYLLAGAYRPIGGDGDDGGDFFADLDTVSVLTERAERIVIMHSEDDFVVPHEESVHLASLLPGAEFVSFSAHNHFLIEEFPELIEDIKAPVV